jgi:fucose permease
MAMPNKKLTLRTCCSVHVLHDGMDDMLYALLPLLREAFGLTYAEVALVRSAHKCATAIFQIPVGIFSEKVGARNSLVFGTALLGVAFLGLGFANAYANILHSFSFPAVARRFITLCRHRLSATPFPAPANVPRSGPTMRLAMSANSPF